MDVDRRKKLMESNYIKRNVFIKRIMQTYEKDYMEYKEKVRKNRQQIESKRKNSGNESKKNLISTSSERNLANLSRKED